MNNISNLREQFINKENLNLLWNVLLDEFNINNSNKKLINNIKIVFESNINPFILKANPRSNIMELNKLFLSQVVLAVNKLLSNNNTSHNNIFKKITISDEEILNEPYKIEDIQSSRQNEFDKSLEQKRMDLENYMTPQKPKELNFSDNKTDSKITSMDSLIAEKMAERNLEIGQLHNSNFNTDNWLTPQETSLKNEKTFITKNNDNNENNRLKYLSIDSNNNITLSINESQQKPQNTTKKVSWNNILADEKEPTINIFNKLKKQQQPIKEEIINIEIEQDIEIEQSIEIEQRTIQYAEQKSIPLPTVKQEEIIRNQTTILSPNNEPILPKTEIIRQLNEMNKKIDNLYEIILKLTNTTIEKETPI